MHAGSPTPHVVHVELREACCTRCTRVVVQHGLLQVATRPVAGCTGALLCVACCTLQKGMLQRATRRVAARTAACCCTLHGVLRAWCAVLQVAPCMLRAARCNTARRIARAACAVCHRRDVRRLCHRAHSAEVIAGSGDADGRSRCAFKFLAAVAAAAWAPTPPLVCRPAVQAAPGRCTRTCGLRAGVQLAASASARTPSRAPPTAPRPRAMSIKAGTATAARCPTCSTG